MPSKTLLSYNSQANPSQSSHYYKGRHFHCPPITSENTLPFLQNQVLSKYKNVRMSEQDGPAHNNLLNKVMHITGINRLKKPIASLDALPHDVLCLIFEYLIADPKSLQHLSMACITFLSTMMQPVKLEEFKRHSGEWYPFLQVIYENRRFNHLTMRGLTYPEYNEQIPNRQHRTTINFLAQPQSLFHKRVRYMIKMKEQPEKRALMIRRKDSYYTYSCRGYWIVSCLSILAGISSFFIIVKLNSPESTPLWVDFLPGILCFIVPLAAAGIALKIYDCAQTNIDSELKADSDYLADNPFLHDETTEHTVIEINSDDNDNDKSLMDENTPLLM